VDSGGEALLGILDVMAVVLGCVEYSVVVVGGSRIVVSPWAPWNIVEVRTAEVVIVDVAVVEGEMTVNWPDGEPVAIRLVAVRTKVEVAVIVLVHCGGPFVVGTALTELPEGEIRQEHAEVTKSELNGDNPMVSSVVRE
jgi:hypothetical protein